MVVAIDGPAGVGKSSVASWVAREFGFFNLNSGAFYRAVALGVLDSNVDPEDEDAVIAIAREAVLDIVDGRLHMNHRDVESLLRTDDVDRASSIVSTIVEVRHLVNKQLRRVANKVNLVAEGRDMTTVVFPDAEVKIFLDADPAVRARRRFNQGSSELSLAELEKTIRERDHRDRNKVEGSLKISGEAVVLDTSTLTLDGVCEKVSGLIKTCL